jgi:ligand-binding sensor domain-containing protein
MTARMDRVLAVSLVTAFLVAGKLASAQDWIPVGPPGGSVRGLASDPTHPERLYLGTTDGILYRSEDGGIHWRRLDPGFPLRGYSLDELAVDRLGVVFVGYWEVDGGGGGVARSVDGGETFTIVKDVVGESVRAVALAPSDQRMIAAGTLTGVFLSRDRGQHWIRITPKGDASLRNVESLAFDPTDPRTLYVGTWHLAWKTRNAGATWAPVHSGMIDDSHVMTLTVDRWNSKSLYATACTGIYRSTEGAMRWTKLLGIPFSSRRTRSFAQSGADANLLLAGTTEGLWLSEDRGESWRRTTSKNLVVNALLVLPDGTIVLGTEGAGVLRSSDLGHTWIAGNSGFSEQFVSKLLFGQQYT